MPRTAKLFHNGRSQAVRLPSEYRFQGSEVFIRRDPASGDIILSRRPESWQDFFELADRIEVPQGFMADRGGPASAEAEAVLMAVRYLLDTNTASDAIKGGVPGVRERLLQLPMAEVGISVITEAELRFGVARLPAAVGLNILVEEFLLRVEVFAVEPRGRRPLCPDPHCS
jgi:antitoxin VapB